VFPRSSRRTCRDRIVCKHCTDRYDNNILQDKSYDRTRPFGWFSCSGWQTNEKLNVVHDADLCDSIIIVMRRQKSLKRGRVTKSSWEHVDIIILETSAGILNYNIIII